LITLSFYFSTFWRAVLPFVTAHPNISKQQVVFLTLVYFVVFRPTNPIGPNWCRVLYLARNSGSDCNTVPSQCPHTDLDT